MSRNTFEHICGLVGPELVRQNTILRQAISVEKQVAVALWRLATGNSYRTVGLTFEIGRCTDMNLKDEFCTALLRRANDFIKFLKTEAETSLLTRSKWLTPVHSKFRSLGSSLLN